MHHQEEGEKYNHTRVKIKEIENQKSYLILHFKVLWVFDRNPNVIQM